MTDRQQVITIDNQSWNIVVDHYGTAGSLKEQLDGVNLDALQQKVLTLHNTASYARDYIGATLANLKTRLSEVWTGQAADQAADIIDKMIQACGKIGDNADQTAVGLNMGVDAIRTAKQQMSGYSHAGADLSNVTSVLGGGPSEDDQAKPVFDALVHGLGDSVHAMPHSLVMPTPVKDSRVTPGPTPGPGPGPGPGGMGPGGAMPASSLPHGSIPSSTIPHPGTLPPGTHPGTIGPGGDPGSIPPVGVGPGGYGPGGSGGIGPGAIGPGGYGPGVGIDSGSQLAGFDGGSGGGAGSFGAGGGGLGTGGGGLGAAGGLGAGGGLGTGSSTAGLGGGGLGAGGGGIGAAGGGMAGRGAAGRGVGMMPMSGGGQGGNGQDRERTTWLAEDEDVWGGDDAPPGVIA